MDHVTVVTLRSAQWASEDYSAVGVVTSSCSLFGRCFTLKRKVKPKGDNKSGLVRSTYQVKNIFNLLLDENILEKVAKKITKNSRKLLRHGRCTWRMIKVEQWHLLQWVGDLLYSGLIGFYKTPTKDSIVQSMKRYHSLFPHEQIHDFFSLFYKEENKIITLFQEINQLQEGLALNFRTTYEPTKILCMKKYKVDFSDRQHSSDLRVVLLLDTDTGYICNFFIYSISQLLSQAECIPLIHIMRRLLTPFCNKNYTLQIDSFAPINESIKEELNRMGIKLEHISYSGGNVKTAFIRQNHILKTVPDMVGYAIFPLDGRNISVTFFVVFWLLVIFSCMNTSILYCMDNTDTEDQLSLEGFVELLSEEIHEISGHLGFTHRKDAANPFADRESYFNSYTEYSETGRSDVGNIQNDQVKQCKLQGVTGLCNLGNTCYMNAVIQCLNCTSPLVEYLFSWQFENYISGNKKEVVIAFANLVADLWFGKEQFVSAEKFWSVISNVYPSFGKQSQQDAQELLIYTLNALHEDLTTSSSRRTSTTTRSSNYTRNNVMDSQITRLLQGVLRQKTVCLECGHTSHKDDIFTVLSLPIPPGNTTSLQECLECFFQQVTLTRTDKMLCSYCKIKRDTSVKMKIYKLPKILILHLKRFEYKSQAKRKLKTNVIFPLNNLDLSPFVSTCNVKNPQYSLYSVENHSGDLDCGHYTACCKHPATKDWHAFDDTEHFHIEESSVQTPLAYILFYTCQTFSLPKKTSSCSVYK